MTDVNCSLLMFSVKRVGIHGIVVRGKDDVHDLNQAGVGFQTAESTVQGLPGIDSSVCGTPSSQRKPPSRFGT